MNEKSENIMHGEMISGICSSVEPVVITEQAVLAMISKGYTIHMNSSPSENDAGGATVSFDFYPGDYEKASMAGKILTSETLVNGHWVDDATGVKVSADTIKMDGGSSMPEKQPSEIFILLDDDDDFSHLRKTGLRLEIGPDPKGLNLMALRYEHNGYTDEMNIDRPQAEALRDWLDRALNSDGGHTVRATNGTIKDMDDDSAVKAMRDAINDGVLKRTEKWAVDSQRKTLFEAMDDLKSALKDAEGKKVYHPNFLNLAAQEGIVHGHSVCGTIHVPRHGALSGLPDIGKIIEAPRMISWNTFAAPYPVHFSIQQATVIGQIEFGSDGNRHVVVEWRNIYPDGPKFDVIPKELISRVVG